MNDQTLSTLIQAAITAGARIMADWAPRRAHAAVIRKSDGSPVTETDRAAEIIVVDAIASISAHPVIAEEAAHAGLLPNIDPALPFWLVDALDGTREFIHGGPDFTVNLALVENGVPVFGIIHAPAQNVTWHAARGKGAFRIQDGMTTQMRVRETPDAGFVVLAGMQSSKPMVMEPFFGAHVVADRLQRSSSLKFCLIANGEADVYSRLGQTYEWDTAAGDIILREAGGTVLNLESRKPIVYGKTDRNFENDGFIAGSRAAFTLQVR